MDQSIFFNPRFFHLITQASPAGMVIADATGTIVLVNLQAEKMFGYPQSELVGEPVEVLIPQLHQSAHRSHRARYMAHPEPRSMAEGRDLFARRRDGTELAVDISLHPIETEQGTYILAHIIDATVRRETEQRREREIAIERLASMGQLAGSVAHEIRTPLAVIRNNIYYLGVLAEQLDEEARECLQEVDEAVSRAEGIVSELLDFTRHRASQTQPVAVRDLFDTSLQDRVARVRAKLTLLPVDEQLSVNVDLDQIQRVLINLVDNAADAAGPDGTVEVSVEASEEEIWIDVADDGPGISTRDRERVFEALYSTKPNGIGLGLALSRRYVESNGGSLRICDHDKSGACFRLTLRRHRPDPNQHH